jgi:cation diffusion facilitator CzcD-associated flavoprotein CzcO
VTSDSTDTSVVVIGGGQAGLSVSYYLKRLGLDPGNEFVVLDRGPGSGGAWQHRWDALRIGSAHRINDLPGMDALGLSFETADRTLPAKDVVADYYEQYERFYEFQVVRPAAVSRVVNAGDRMLVSFSDPHGEQTVSTDVVINATGTWGSPFIPWYPGRDSFLGRHVHTAEYADAAQFAGKSVVVVGGGTSAIGFLLELESVASHTTWVSRRPIEFLEDGELNLEARASAVALQDEAARAGKALPSIVAGTGVPRTRRIQAGIDRGVLTARPMFSAIEPNGVRWSNGSFQEADVIIWSTGFRPELRHLAPLKLREKEGGIMVANGTSWKEPRIFFAGYGPQASTIGANRAGRTVARQAIATLSRLKRQEREADDARLAAEAARNGEPAPFVFLPPEPSVVAELISPTVSVEPTSLGAHAAEPAPVETPETPETHARHAEDSQEDFDLSWMLPSSEPIVPIEFFPDEPAAAEPVHFGSASAPAAFTGFPAPAEPFYVEFEPAPDAEPTAVAEPVEAPTDSTAVAEPTPFAEPAEAPAELPAPADSTPVAVPVEAPTDSTPPAEPVEAPAEPTAPADSTAPAEPTPVAEPVEAPVRALTTFAAAAIALAAGERVDPSADTEADPAAQPDPEAQAEPEAEAEPETELDTETAEPNTASQDGPDPDATTAIELPSAAEAEPEPQPEPENETEEDVESAHEPQSEPESQSDSVPASQSDAVPETQPEARPKPDEQPAPEPEAQTEPAHEAPVAPVPVADPRVALILDPEPVAPTPAPASAAAPETRAESAPAFEPPANVSWSLDSSDLPAPVSASDDSRDYVFRFEVEPQDDDFDDSTKPREHVRPLARELPDFDELLNPRNDD